MNTIRKAQLLQKRKWRIRKKVAGSALRPRLCVHFSGKHIYAQAIDDEQGRTLLTVSTLAPDLREQKTAANVKSAKTVGAAFAAKATAAGITSVVFDRNGRRFHGKVKSFADAAREGGLKF
jgi:large subunit ribosomal protein L18